MTTNQKTKLSDFMNDESNDKLDNNEANDECDEEPNGEPTAEPPSERNESPTSTELSDELIAPDNPEPCNGPICLTYHEERTDERWQQLIDEHSSLKEPRCGHGIDYLKSEAGAAISIESAIRYSSSMFLYVGFLHERGVNVCKADLRDIRMFFNMRVRNNRSESTLKLDRTAIGNLYKHIRLYRDAESILSRELILEEIDPSAYQTKEPLEREPLTKKEISLMLDAADGLQERLIILVGIELGPRNTDLCKLKIGDVDLDEKTTTLSNTKAGGNYTLPLSDRLALLLRRWIEVERPATGVAEDNPYLFPSERGGSYTKSSIQRIVHQVAERAGIQEVIGVIPLTENQKCDLWPDRDVRNSYKVDVHTLRHTFNNLMEKADIPREARSAALDHSTTYVTEEFYDHEEDDHKRFLEENFAGASEFDSMDEDNCDDC